jgi:hypothetical protein
MAYVAENSVIQGALLEELAQETTLVDTIWPVRGPDRDKIPVCLYFNCVHSRSPNAFKQVMKAGAVLHSSNSGHAKRCFSLSGNVFMVVQAALTSLELPEYANSARLGMFSDPRPLGPGKTTRGFSTSHLAVRVLS